MFSERTLARAKKTLGVMSYREGETGERGKGRWLWKLPAVDLMDDIEDARLVIKDAEGCQEQHGGSLNQCGGLKETESRIAKPDVLRMPPTEEVPIKDANPIKDARVPTLENGGNLKECWHGYPGGKDCYLCDPDHSYRNKSRTV